VATAAYPAVHGAEDPEDGADHRENDADRVQDRDAEHNPEDEEDDSDDEYPGDLPRVARRQTPTLAG
jgi:hypothetical protein